MNRLKSIISQCFLKIILLFLPAATLFNQLFYFFPGQKPVNRNPDTRTQPHIHTYTYTRPQHTLSGGEGGETRPSVLTVEDTGGSASMSIRRQRGPEDIWHNIIWILICRTTQTAEKQTAEKLDEELNQSFWIKGGTACLEALGNPERNIRLETLSIWLVHSTHCHLLSDLTLNMNH